MNINEKNLMKIILLCFPFLIFTTFIDYKNILGELIPYNLRKNIQFCNNCYNNKSYTVRSKFEDDVYQYILKITNETEKIICNRKVGEHFYIYDNESTDDSFY